MAKKNSSFIYYDHLILDVALAEITDETRKEFVEKVLGNYLKKMNFANIRSLFGK
ncbi:hypothetical protein KHA80_03975 [Anaerobacillus sp. HL2]|nr:hypothetical protein KHA80_03975 [Anaerobacillus sp. HL2]